MFAYTQYGMFMCICSHFILLCKFFSVQYFFSTSRTASSTSLQHFILPVHTFFAIIFMHNRNIENNLTLCLKHKMEKRLISTQKMHKKKLLGGEKGRRKCLHACVVKVAKKFKNQILEEKNKKKCLRVISCFGFNFSFLLTFVLK